MAKSRSTQRETRVGSIHTLGITDLNHDGDGVGRTEEGMVLFVPGALPGEQVRVRIETVKRRHATATLIAGGGDSAFRPSPQRVQARCAVAGECGGCRLQHYDYPSQLVWKAERVRAALSRIGGLDGVNVRPMIGMADPYHYRNKAQYPLRRDETGRVRLGFYRRGSHEVVPHEDCAIQHPVIPEVAAACRQAIEELDISVYDEENHTGAVRHLVIRTSFANDEAVLILVTRSSTLPESGAFIDRIRALCPQVVGVVQNVNAARTNAIFGPETRSLWGKSTLVERLGDLEFEISPTSFFQVNPIQAVRLYDSVVELAETTSGSVWDLYCGAGSIGLYLLQGASMELSVKGIDSVAAAIADARRNAAHNGLQQSARFEVGRAEWVVPQWVDDGERASLCLLDPPRSGCAPELLRAVGEADPRRIVYVSCNPSTLARDLALLANLGYRTKVIQPVDMFPQTPHIEAVAQLERD